jgi:outer membrane assembly lipoprotein YfiO
MLHYNPAMRFAWMMLTALLLAPAAMAAEPSTVELRGNQWVEVNSPTTEPTTDAELIRIEQLVSQRRHKEARGRLVKWFQRNPSSPVRDRALYLMAEALYQKGDRIRAFFYLDQLLDEYPDSPLFYPALDVQYQIADAYLEGYKRRFLGLHLLTARDEAVDMLYRIQQRVPGSQIAEKSLLRTADFFYADAQYDLAGDAYAAYARSYPRSPAIARVRLRQAFSNYAQFRGLRFDATPLVDARAQLAEMVALYPDLADEEGLPAIVERIDRTFAEKMFVTADFYRRTKEPRAAAYTYQTLIEAYPHTAEAQKAQRELDRMPAWTKQMPRLEDPANNEPPPPMSSADR